MMEETLRHAMSEAVRDIAVDGVDHGIIRSATRRVAFGVTALAALVIATVASVSVAVGWIDDPRPLPATGATASPSSGREADEQIEEMIFTLRQELRFLRSARAEVASDLRKVTPHSNAPPVIKALRERKADLQSEMAELEARIKALRQRLRTE